MTPKGSSTDDARSALRDLIDRSEEVVNVFVEELTGSSSLRQEIEKTLERANLARKTVDRNLEAVLGALNLPTRRDYRRLVEEIHALQGSIVNLNMKMDRLLAATTAAAASTPVPAVGAAVLPSAAGAAQRDAAAGTAGVPAAKRTARRKARPRKAAPAKSAKRAATKKRSRG